jgi:hypothetical protein
VYTYGPAAVEMDSWGTNRMEDILKQFYAEQRDQQGKHRVNVRLEL